MRDINQIIVHCTYTKPSMDIGANDVRKWHTDPKPGGNGWSDIGYHFVIRRDGSCEGGRPIESAGAHAMGHNSDSIGIALVGGMSESGKPESNFTAGQYAALKELLLTFMGAHDIDKDQIIGHNQVSDKECPCFNVPSFLEGL